MSPSLSRPFRTPVCPFSSFDTYPLLWQTPYTGPRPAIAPSTYRSSRWQGARSSLPARRAYRVESPASEPKASRRGARVGARRSASGSARLCRGNGGSDRCNPSRPYEATAARESRGDTDAYATEIACPLTRLLRSLRPRNRPVSRLPDGR